MPNTTTTAFYRVWSADVVATIDGFRNTRLQKPRKDADDLGRNRLALFKCQHQWISLRRKVSVTRRFDVELPPFPSRDRMDGTVWADVTYVAELFEWFRMHYSC